MNNKNNFFINKFKTVEEAKEYIQRENEKGNGVRVCGYKGSESESEDEYIIKIANLAYSANKYIIENGLIKKSNTETK